MSSYYPVSTDQYYDNEAYITDRETYQEGYRSYIPNAEIAIFEPTSFEEISDAIHALKAQRMVVLNLVRMEPEEAQRSIDFMAGGTFIFNGSLEQLDPKIFLFAPHSTEITYETQKGQQNSQEHHQALRSSHWSPSSKNQTLLDRNILKHKAS